MENLQAAVIVLIIIFAIALYAFVNSGSPPSPYTTTSTAVSGTKTLSPNAVLLGQVLNTTASNVSAQPQFGANYSGYASFGIVGTNASSAAYNVPLLLSYQRYGNFSRLAARTASPTIVGNISIVYMNLNGSRYYCSSGAALTVLGISNASLTSGFSCIPINSSIEASLLQSSDLQLISGAQGLSALSSVPLLDSGIRSVNGTGCTLFSGSMNSSAPVLGLLGSYPQAYYVSTCVSNMYDIPLNFTAAQGSVVDGKAYYLFYTAFDLVSIYNSVNETLVSTLPGPVSVQGATANSLNISTISHFNLSAENISSLIGGLSTGANSSLGSYSLKNECIAAPQYLCQDLSATNNAVNFSFGQNLGYTIYNPELSCSSGVSGAVLSFQNIYNGTVAYASLQDGAQVSVADLQCPGTPPQDTQYLSNWLFGTIILNYTLQQGPPSQSNPWRQGTVAAFVTEQT